MAQGLMRETWVNHWREKGILHYAEHKLVCGRKPELSEDGKRKEEGSSSLDLMGDVMGGRTGHAQSEDGQRNE